MLSVQYFLALLVVGYVPYGSHLFACFLQAVFETGHSVKPMLRAYAQVGCGNVRCGLVRRGGRSASSYPARTGEPIERVRAEVERAIKAALDADRRRRAGVRAADADRETERGRRRAAR